METSHTTQQSVTWQIAETLVVASAVAATIAGLGMALHLVVGAVRLALTFIV